MLIISTLDYSALIIVTTALGIIRNISRNSSVVEEALNLWKATVEMRRVSQALAQYEQAERLFTEWRLNRQSRLRPSQKEVEQFLWLM